MTKDEWLSCEEPRLMLNFLGAIHRKRRLLVCALARSLWVDLPDERSRAAVEVAEAFADGHESLYRVRHTAAQARQAHDELCSVFIAARRATGGKYRRHVKVAAARANASAVAAWATSDEPLGFWNCTTEWLGDELSFYDEEATVEALLQEHRGLVLELFGNPFSAVRVEPAWLAWGDGAVVKLARAVYETRRFEDMPVLGDALEDAGCQDAGILGHCRQGAEHARGCWVLDLVLGKK